MSAITRNRPTRVRSEELNIITIDPSRLSFVHLVSKRPRSAVRDQQEDLHCPSYHPHHHHTSLIPQTYTIITVDRPTISDDLILLGSILSKNTTTLDAITSPNGVYKLNLGTMGRLRLTQSSLTDTYHLPKWLIMNDGFSEFSYSVWLEEDGRLSVRLRELGWRSGRSAASSPNPAPSSAAASSSTNIPSKQATTTTMFSALGLTHSCPPTSLESHWSRRRRSPYYPASQNQSSDTSLL